MRAITVSCLSLVLSLLSLVSCAPPDTELSGEYVYRNKAGQVEALILRKDNTYSHELYDDDQSFIDHATPFKSVSGKIEPWPNGRPGANIMDLWTNGEWSADMRVELVSAPLDPIVSRFSSPELTFDPVAEHYLHKVYKRSEIKEIRYVYPD